MSMDYTAGVFFGACVARKSPLGKKLDKYIDRDGGTPAKTGVEIVEIGLVGAQSTGELWVTVQAKGSEREYGRGHDFMAPSMLTEDPAWRPAIVAFLEKIKAPAIDVGWHFQASVF
jgi:hypothetical protein